MKITKLEFVPVKPRWVFMKLHTDEGIVGYGEPVLEGRAKTVMQAVRELESYLIGQDPLRIEHHWQAMYRGTFYRGGPILVSAISGIDQALWDIFGKWTGLPVYQLLGGPTRDRIRMYAHVRGETPEKAAEAAKGVVAKGFTALKTGFPISRRVYETPGYIGRCVAQLAAMRAAVGEEVDIAIDFFHGGYPPAMAIRLAKELEPYHPLFIEEPCLPENVDTMVTIARATSIPIATGERLFTRWGYRDLIEKQGAAILQPDLCHAGGISEVRRIAAMAEPYYMMLAPHCPLGPIALAACLQLDAAIPNFLIQEHVTLGEGYLKQPFVVKDGYIELSKAPGLGIELDEEALADKGMDPNWDSPRVWFEDGAVADW